MATIYIGHASKDENGKYIDGKAGDQTGKEVCKRTYYNQSKGWYAIRPKLVKHANAIADAAEQAAANDNIGYDQGERLDIMTSLKKYGSLAKIAEPTECDCSSLMRACIYQATGIDVGNFTTANEVSILAKSGLFEDKFDVSSSSLLCNGDVIVTKTKGHTAAVVSGNPRKDVSTSATNNTQSSKNDVATSSTNSTQTAVVAASNKNRIDTVKEVQIWANNNYNSGLEEDGIYGKKTKRALVKILQIEINKTLAAKDKLVVDGIWGVKTKAACPTIKKGSKNSLVGVLQAFLICNGYNEAYLDKDYGSLTASSVESYQQKKGLVKNGAADKNTFAKLCS